MEIFFFSVNKNIYSSKIKNNSPTKVIETATVTLPSVKYTSPVKSIEILQSDISTPCTSMVKSQQHTPSTIPHSGSRFSPKTSSPIKKAFETERSRKFAQRKLFRDTMKELIFQTIDNLNSAKEGVIADNNINLEKVYASKKFDYKYKSINTATSTRYEIKHIVIPKEPYALHFFLAVVTVFSKPVNCGYFDEDELDYVFSLLTLSEDAQKLFIRLLKRKHKWHRISNVKYDEVENLRPIFDELVSRSIFKSSMFEEDLSILLDLLQVDEIHKLCKGLKLKIKGKMKKNCIQSILKLSTTKSLFPGMPSPIDKLRVLVNKHLGDCVILKSRVKEMVDKIITLLIPNRDPTKSLSDVFYTIWQVEMNEIKFPQVTISDLPIFASKQHLLEYVTFLKNFIIFFCNFIVI